MTTGLTAQIEIKKPKRIEDLQVGDVVEFRRGSIENSSQEGLFRFGGFREDCDKTRVPILVNSHSGNMITRHQLYSIIKFKDGVLYSPCVVETPLFPNDKGYDAEKEKLIKARLMN